MSEPYANKSYKAYRQWVRATRPACAICGKLGADTVDHRTPLIRGGSNVAGNWQPAHAKCNFSKGSKIRLRYTAPY